MSRRPLVVVPDFLTEASLEQRVLEDVADVRALANPEEDEILRQAPEADVLIFFHEVRLTGRSLAQLLSLSERPTREEPSRRAGLQTWFCWSAIRSRTFTTPPAFARWCWQDGTSIAPTRKRVGSDPSC